MKIRIRGTETEARETIRKISLILTVVNVSPPYRRDRGQVDIYLEVYL